MHPLRPMHLRAPTPSPGHAMPPPPRIISGQTFRCLPGRECLELVGEPAVTITGCAFHGGSTCLRLNGCGTVLVQGCQFDGMAGPPDPDGNGIQIIRPEGAHVIDRCTFVASPQAEDLLNVFGDAPSAGSVLITGCSWIGRGVSDSSTSLCLDGPCCVPTVVRGGRIQGARCGITVAGLGGATPHTIEGVRFVACGVKVYAYAGYGTPPRVVLTGYTAADVLLGAGLAKGSVLVQG